MKHFIKYFKPYVALLAVLIALIWIQANVSLSLPDFMAKIINEGIVKKDLNAVWNNGFQMLFITLIGGIVSIIIGFIAAKISAGYARKLREDVFIKIERFSLNEFNSFSSSSLVTRATNDMQQIQTTTAMILRIAFFAPFMGIGAVVKANQLAPSMSWIILVSVSVMVSVIVMMFFVVIPKFTIIQKLVDKLSLNTREMLTGIRVIRAYNNDKTQQNKFDSINIESTRLNIFVSRIMTLMQPIMTLVMGVASMAVVWVGSYVVSDGNLQVGNLFALMQYVMQTIFAFLMISMIFIMVPRTAVSWRRVNEVLSTKNTIKDSKDSVVLPKKINGIIEFNNVNFGYSGSEHPVLSDISFTSKPGEMTAIIGGTGSGKSTLINLIPRLYDVSAGSITIDGIDIRNIKQSSLHDHIGYIPQKASLFSGTIKSNVAYGESKVNKKDIDSALKIAQAADFVNNLSDGLDGSVSQSGNNLSGGQKQRLSIARALFRKSEIYLFDDSFSALDFKTDSILRTALKKELSRSTFIVVAQRISTIMQADKIIVLDDGKIVGVGTHKELLKKSAVYKEIAESQLSATELGEDK